MTISPAQASAIVTGSAIVFGLLILSFNLGRLDMAASARVCKPATLSYSIPFKGTLP